MPRIIAIANQKGGVGKTTTAITLAHGLALQGRRVLLVDCDPQGQTAVALRMKREPGVYTFLTTADLGSTGVDYVRQWVRPTGREGLWLLPGNKDTSGAQILIAQRPISFIRDRLKLFFLNSSAYDYIIADTAPSAGGVQERMLWASDWVIIPVKSDYLSSDGASQIVQMLVGLRNEMGWKGKLFGVLPTFFDERTNESRRYIGVIKQHFDNVALPPVHLATVLEASAAEGKTVFEKAPDSRSAHEYMEIVTRVLKSS